eukprot:364281-Chlamydomonas_euryale.AAC.4
MEGLGSIDFRVRQSEAGKQDGGTRQQTTEPSVQTQEVRLLSCDSGMKSMLKMRRERGRTQVRGTRSRHTRPCEEERPVYKPVLSCAE